MRIIDARRSHNNRDVKYSSEVKFDRATTFIGPFDVGFPRDDRHRPSFQKDQRLEKL
jgi:hypothetical protein